MRKPIKFIKIIFFVLIILTILCYSYYQMKDYLKGPVLVLTEPVDNSTLYQNDILVKGYAKNISYISMNGGQIFTNQAGQFGEEILLSEGLNIIEIVVKDKYGRQNQQTLNLVYLVK